MNFLRKLCSRLSAARFLIRSLAFLIPATSCIAVATPAIAQADQSPAHAPRLLAALPPTAGLSSSMISPPGASPATDASRHSASSGNGGSSFGVGVSQGFLINGRPIRVEAFTSALKGRHPAVIMLYGAHGLGAGSLMLPTAQALPRMGISAYIVHYSNGVGGEDWAAPKLSEMRDQVLEQVVSYVASLSDTDPQRIGVFGLSTGAFTALERASRDPRIKVVVDMVGGMPESVGRESLRHMPPVLILHGECDTTVPVARAYELLDLMTKVGAESEIHLYPGQGHSFQGGALLDASRHATGFFMRHLLPRAEVAYASVTATGAADANSGRSGQIRQVRLP